MFLGGILLLAFGLPVGAQDNLPIIGIFDDPEMTLTSGSMRGTTKRLYVAVDPRSFSGTTGLEFSIVGLEPFTIVEQYLDSPVIVLGSAPAPPDTTTGTGGVNVAWASCLKGSRVFLYLDLSTPTPPENHVLSVHKRFPPSNPAAAFPRHISCDCDFCLYTTHGGTYVLNPPVGAIAHDWGAIKALYATRP